jgi:ribosome maturation factor RimP
MQMQSFANTLKGMLNREVTVWLTHIDLKALAGKLAGVHQEHVELVADGNSFHIPYTAIVAVRPS